MTKRKQASALETTRDALPLADQAWLDRWFDEQPVGRVRPQLIRWFARHQRDLPWRQQRTPYRVWVSEIMLQQTQVATVIDYYRRFLERFPTVQALAAAPEQEVLRAWEGLGYYRRARQLQAAARVIATDHQGVFPQTPEAWQDLPGIGRYTAGAISSIALDYPAPILEGNTIRLYARLLGLEADVKERASQKILWAFAEKLIPSRQVGDFNQALMEVGSQICRVRQPLCPSCPLARVCVALQTSRQHEIPVSPGKVRYESVVEGVVLIRRGSTVLLRECQPGERWAGLWDFPRYPLAERHALPRLEQQLAEDFGLRVTLHDTRQIWRHAVTRYRIELKCLEARTVQGRLRAKSNAQWVPLKRLPEMPLSVTGRKAVEFLLSRIDSAT